MKKIDLNSDLGEGSPYDSEIMELISSANVACGFHAGDPATAFATMKSASAKGVHVGAHPGFPDRENFGRSETFQRSEKEIFQDCVYQIGALIGLANAVGTEVRYIKPHGALYNLGCRDENVARPIVAAAKVFQLPLLGLPGSQLQKLATNQVPFLAEGFADRRYQSSGILVPRDQPNALVETVDEAILQVRMLIAEKHIQTICVHGDNPLALSLVRELRAALIQQGIQIEAAV